MITLINDDCLNVIQSLKNENTCIVTDPPFNIGYHYKTYKDNLPKDDYYKMLISILGGGRPCVDFIP